jgi:hypothetical protein
MHSFNQQAANENKEISKSRLVELGLLKIIIKKKEYDLPLNLLAMHSNKADDGDQEKSEHPSPYRCVLFNPFCQRRR